MSYPVHIKQGNIYSGYNLSNVENIDELPTAVSVSKDDLLIINDGTESKKATVEDVLGEFVLNATTTTDTSNFSGTVNEYINTTKRIVLLEFSLTTLKALTAPLVRACGEISNNNYIPFIDSPSSPLGVFDGSTFTGYILANKNSVNKTIAAMILEDIPAGRSILGTIQYFY